MDATLAALLPLAARDHGGATAVVDGARAVTYGELEAQAADLAAALAARGVGHGDRVGVYLPKSVEAIAALHAILRVGAAYVPLDPKGPPQRLAQIVRDAELALLVTAADMATRCDALAGEGATPERLMVESIPRGAGGSLDVRAPTSDDLAYLLFTSGSTGVPKGVELTHRSAMAFVEWAVRSIELRSEDRLTSHAPLHFDLSIFDVFGAAAAGATLVIVPQRALVFPAEAARLVEAHEITVWYSVPSALALLATRAGLEPGRLPSLRTVIFAGEVFPIPHLAELARLLPDVDLWNWYGPTETNVCTAHRVVRPVTPDDPPLPIGHPIDGVLVRIVDEALAPVAMYEQGELLVAGPTVAAGYRGDPARTAERFVEDGGHRWYRTGDLAALRHDGALEFRGRLDDQVKSRGHRIELGEVEAVLLRHPAVHEGAVVARPDPLVTTTLHAAVVVDDPVQLDAVRAHLREQLPAAMVPETVEVVAAVPRTSTGKVDRVALAAALAAHA